MVLVGCRSLAIGALTAIMVFCQLTVANAGGHSPRNHLPAAPTDCSLGYEQSLKKLDHAGESNSGASCGRDGSRRGPYAGGSNAQRMDVNLDGTCTAYWDAPVTFQDLPAFIRATWTPPDGGKQQQQD